jgi:DNA-binding NtrC family response regulator
MCALLQEWLCSAGYFVQVAAPHSTEAVGKVDLAIVSIYMPKHAGAHLLQDVQAAHPRTPLIALSGQFRGGLSSVGSTAKSLGVAQVIAKPLTRDALLGAVHAMIGPPN